MTSVRRSWSPTSSIADRESLSDVLRLIDFVDQSDGLPRDMLQAGLK
jgi:hypothetical protein